MATNSQYLNGQLSDAQIEQLIQSLRGIKPVENDILNAEKTVNKEKMASLYISTFVSHKDRAGFIDEPKTSSSLRKTGLTFSLDELLFLFMFVFVFSFSLPSSFKISA
jgi:hypothetical protein